jgi:hypothetical protein
VLVAAQVHAKGFAEGIDRACEFYGAARAVFAGDFQAVAGCERADFFDILRRGAVQLCEFFAGEIFPVAWELSAYFIGGGKFAGV